MKTDLSLLLAGSYDRIRLLQKGHLTSSTLELRIDVTENPPEVFNRLCFSEDYDGGELSLSFFTTMRSKQGKSCPFVALPIPLSRMFRHGNILINSACGIDSPSDLNGRIIGLPEYGLTMGVWARAALMHDFGLVPSTVRWRTGREPVMLRPEDVKYPEGVDISRAGETNQLIGMLAAGELDAYIGPTPTSVPVGTKRLFSDFGSIEKEYYARTGLFPIMHILVLRRRWVERHPGLVEEVISLFWQAKDAAIENLKSGRSLNVSLPWLNSTVEEQQQAMGGDLWPYGIEANVRPLQAFIDYSYEQGLLWRKMDYKELFE